jgi:hypothetical protein
MPVAVDCTPAMGGFGFEQSSVLKIGKIVLWLFWDDRRSTRRIPMS